MIATSDIPGGVVNMVYGSQSPLSLTLAQHQHVQAVWYFGYPEGALFICCLVIDIDIDIDIEITTCLPGYINRMEELESFK